MPNEQPEKDEQGSTRGFGLWFAAAIAGVAVGSVLYLQLPPHGNANSATRPATSATAALSRLATGEVAAFTAKDEPTDVPPVTFDDAAGNNHSLADWRGKVIVLNLWATWCAPCRREMPALDQLKAELGGKDFDVLAIATDRGGIEKPQKFWTENSIKSLGLFAATSDAQHDLGILGLPTTLIIGRDGKELGRLIGPAEWTSPDARALLAAARSVN